MKGRGMGIEKSQFPCRSFPCLKTCGGTGSVALPPCLRVRLLYLPSAARLPTSVLCLLQLVFFGENRAKIKLKISCAAGILPIIPTTQ